MFAIVKSNFNTKVTSGLLNGCLNALNRQGIQKQQINIFEVPGAFEIPFMINKVLKFRTDFDAVIALGAIIKGETDHYHFISDSVTKGIMQITQNSEIPIIFGVLTCQNSQLAYARSGNDKKNKGFEAGEAAIEMLNQDSYE